MVLFRHIGFYFGGFFLLIFLLVCAPSIAQKKNKLKYKTFDLKLNAQSVSGGEIFSDLKRRVTYSLSEANYNEDKIDIGYLYGQNWGGTLLVPASSGYRFFGKELEESVYSGWDKKNDGLLINIGSDAAAQLLFNKTRSADTLVEKYNYFEWAISGREDYKVRRNGPNQYIREISIGDIILFKSLKRNLYAMMRVESILPLYHGFINLKVKLAYAK